MKSICAVIVTYNRKDYLSQLLEKLPKQSYPLTAVLIYDNNSTDGTPEMLKKMGIIEEFHEDTLIEKYSRNISWLYYRSSENSGGAGGFHGGIKIASQKGFDYLWTMDDDVSPEVDCLETLVKHMSDSSRICIPSRTDDQFVDNPVLRFNLRNPFKEMVADWIPSREMVEDTVRVMGMAFEGPLISTELIKEIGLPKKELFIFFDDTDYATRASKKTDILYCRKAVLHKLIIPSYDRSYLMNWKDYYNYRNMIWFYRTYGENIWIRNLRPVLIVANLYARSIVRQKWTNLKVLRKAYLDGVRENLGKQVAPGTKGCDF